jgi:F0F1-type ATP synthase assembly protein I
LKKKAQPALVLMAIFPAIMVAVLLPLLTRFHVTDPVLGFVVGCLIGLSVASIIVMARRHNSCA